MHNPYPEQSAAPDERGDVARVVAGEHNDPYAVLGMHDGPTDGAVVVRCLLPGIDSVDVLESSTGVVRGSLAQVDAAGFFAATVSAPQGRFGYRLRITDHNGTRDIDDPYAFPPLLGELDVHLLAEGAHWRAYECLGAHPRSIEGVEGVAFAVWAPNAQRVSVVGPFNAWNGRVHAMRLRIECGVWEIFLPGIRPGASYKFEVLAQDGEIVLKSDPYAFRTEAPPATVACVAPANAFNWNDSTWMAHRGKAQATDAPIAIYEVHLGSWRRHPDGTSYSYDELADELIPYAVEMGFTHLELLPVSEHPFTGSWGYQPISLFAPSARWGEPDGFRRFVDRCHAAGLAVLLDWVPAHFPQDPHGLVRFDGSCLYEYEDTRIGRHHAWGTLVYNFGRREVANFLIVNALFWLREFHVDGLRVDAVASMLYLDYERKPGEWLPNIHGGRENLEAVAFLRRLNVLVHSEAPAGAVTFAEESTTWPMVTGPEHLGGLGFDYKWNMGWMNDTLAYMRLDPIHRRFHHHLLTFGQMYATSENFVLPLSHDEMVHGKGSLIGKMPGDRWRKFANLRLYLAFQYTDPGKKLLFMGGEFAQEREWNHDRDLDWSLLADPAHAGVQRLLRDLNGLYRTLDCLHSHDCDRDGFRWIDCNDVEHSVLAWRRIGGHPRDFAVIVCNFTPVPRHGYRIGVPIPGEYREVLNTDALAYGGSGVDNPNHLSTAPTSWHGEAQSLTLTLPPLAALVLLPPAEAEEMEADVIEADLIEAAPPDVLPRDP